ncbi:10946_t:CDS:2, partial [Dentiscutata heterogama]
MKDNLVTTQRAIIEKDTLLQEAVLNKAYLAEQIPKISSKSEVARGVLEELEGNIRTYLENHRPRVEHISYQRSKVYKSQIAICFKCWQLVKITEVEPKK